MNKRIKKIERTYSTSFYNIHDLYRYYREMHSENSKLMEIQRPLFKTIISEYNKVIVDYLLKGNKLRLPYTLGEIYVEKRKMNYKKVDRLPIDWGHFTKSEGKEKIFILNEHSNGWKVRFKWDKKHCRVDNHKYYSFRPCRATKAQLVKIMKTEGGYLHFNEAKSRK